MISLTAGSHATGFPQQKPSKCLTPALWIDILNPLKFTIRNREIVPWQKTIEKGKPQNQKSQQKTRNWPIFVGLVRCAATPGKPRRASLLNSLRELKAVCVLFAGHMNVSTVARRTSASSDDQDDLKSGCFALILNAKDADTAMNQIRSNDRHQARPSAFLLATQWLTVSLRSRERFSGGRQHFLVFGKLLFRSFANPSANGLSDYCTGQISISRTGDAGAVFRHCLYRGPARNSLSGETHRKCFVPSLLKIINPDIRENDRQAD
jgi:hypothetical protein